MKRSISLVMPVRNAEEALAENLQHIFDVLSDLTDQFEVLLVDQGSTDHTAELAHDLSIQYPQLRVVAPPSGDSVQASLQQTKGDVVLVQDPHTPFSPARVRRLWEAGPGRRAPRQASVPCR